MSKLPDLPVVQVLDQIIEGLAGASNLVLVAPPGAGKTTLVPLALLNTAWRQSRKIIVLEPRRLAARAAAQRMAHLLGEKVGETVGYRIRFDNRVSDATQIEVVTEGVFSRMLAEDPGLESVAAVLFDEFHERSLDGDLALALCLDLQAALREDLRLLPMSATLESDAIAELLDAKLVESKGRTFPVEIVHRDRSSDMRVENAMADAVRQELGRPDGGSILVFLPGQGEIERVGRLLEDNLPAGVELHRLYGALPQKAQDAAIQAPATGVRKVVISSAIAETSLTIEGVTCVIDSGLSRQPVFEPATGLTRLQTVRASQASVVQRAGRAGRLGPGRAIRLWRAEQTAALPPRTPPEILNADLSSLLLALADWGVTNPDQLHWLDAPPKPALQEAKILLQQLGALSPDNHLTPHGKALSQLALPPRYAHMVLTAATASLADAEMAALLSLLVQERGVGGHSVDLEDRLHNLQSARDQRARRVRQLAGSLAKRAHSLAAAAAAAAATAKGKESGESAGTILASGLQDRIAQRRGPGPNGTVRYLLANGRGAELDATESLCRQDFIVVVDMVGRAGAARILSAASITKTELLDRFAEQIEERLETKFDPGSGSFSAKQTRRLGALILEKPKSVKLAPQDIATALQNGVAEHGLDILPWRDKDVELRHKLALLHRQLGDPWPDVGDEALVARRGEWLEPFLTNAASLESLGDGSLSNGLMLLAGHPSKSELDRLVPSQFVAPSGSNLTLTYADESVVLRVRPQELFGLDRHPMLLDGRLAIELELVSPAGRPIQITRDLPGFWRGSWRDVRADLRGRYPKHPWPEDALTASATARAKPRK
ncbi:MAG: ATP-dependent helicase HrpB [Rhizobiaceae bacterium]